MQCSIFIKKFVKWGKILLAEPGDIKLLLFFEFLVVSFYFTKKLCYLKRKIKTHFIYIQ